ncbi:hypothetical protein [Nguyenibacter sp. L1]|uniref:hypothetical protein n=1 Tax=Nguyenibacter sp. L1 TaxID=3049350 RepID=UPI002B49355D|nr:hypothetical protein [Nguyenibacter sp. L1]WRH86484.1 hypothetical protein QN315_10595 [Nguyenibacter sp. L1]
MMAVIAAFLSSPLPLACMTALAGCAALYACRAPAPRAIPVRATPIRATRGRVRRHR